MDYLRSHSHLTVAAMSAVSAWALTLVTFLNTSKQPPLPLPQLQARSELRPQISWSQSSVSNLHNFAVKDVVLKYFDKLEFADFSEQLWKLSYWVTLRKGRQQVSRTSLQTSFERPLLVIKCSFPAVNYLERYVIALKLCFSLSQCVFRVSAAQARIATDRYVFIELGSPWPFQKWI